jgi:Xaa-Pro aminopeptidase
VSARTERLAANLDEPLLVTNPQNVRYLVGFQSSNAALLVDPSGSVQLFTDFRYREAARAVDGVELVETKRALLKDLAMRLSGRVAVEAAHITYAGYRTLADGGLDVLPRTGAVEELRAVKDETEIAAIRRACAISDRVFARLGEERFVGRTERDLAWRIAELFHDEGADGPAYETIVASGTNGAKPHGRASDRVIGEGETVTIDAGCLVDGYFSDYTRTFATGELDGELREAYDVCLQAQEAALGSIRAGMTGVDADATARRVVEESPFAGLFGHGLGHGLGLDLHEDPRMSTESEDVLAPGNVVTVEPGIYVPGRGGIRIEDDVVVRDGGIENLTGVTKRLVTVA